MPTVVQDVSGDSALQTAIAALKAKIEGAEESSDIAQLLSDINIALAGKQNTLTFDSAPSSGSSNPVTSGGVKTALDGKQDTLTFDNEPTAESTKPVTSGGVKEALDDMYSEISDRMTAAEEDIDIRGGAIYESPSGSLVEIADGGDNLPMKSAVVTMEPIQDLHGYDYPWPAGGEKNLIDTSAVSSGKGLTITNNADGSIHVVGTPTGTWIDFSSAYNVYIPAGNYTLSLQSEIPCNFVLYSFYENDANRNTNTITNGYKLKTVSFESNVDRIYIGLSGLNTSIAYDFTIYPQLEAGSEATSYAPYENICPISGRTGLSVVRAGVNVWDEETEYGYYSAENGQIGSSINTQLRSKNYISVKPSTSYCFKKPNNLGDILFYDANKSYISALLNVGSNRVFTTPGNCYYIRLNLGSAYGNTYNHDIGLNYPATNIEYHAYKGNTYSVNWESEVGTVYGGTLDVVSGKLIVNRAMVVIDGANKRVNPNGMTGTTSNAIFKDAVGKAYGESNFISDRFRTGSGVYSIIGRDYSISIEFKLPVDIPNDSTALNQWFADNPTQLVYELATPTEIQLTPQEVRTLLGENNIWSDGGDISVEYPADTKMYIDNKIAEAIAAALA